MTGGYGSHRDFGGAKHRAFHRRESPQMMRESHLNADIPRLKSSYIKRARSVVLYRDEHPLLSQSRISSP
ncbi:hypothetical protein PCAR4_350141 [Paraburkholderia caribensis]|nr:hypothetical protein PCAR4_350141 [Paraburkholderia caribensis]